MRRPVALALSLVGLFVSAYLWWIYTSPSRPMVCLGTGCDVVRASSYANLLGIPLPAYGAAMYTALALLIFAGPLFTGGLEIGIRAAVATMAGGGFLVSLYLTGIEGFALHAWCAWCVASAVVVTLVFILSLLELVRPVPQADSATALEQARTQFLICVLELALGVPAFILLVRSGELPPVSPQQASPQTLREHLWHPDSHMAGSPSAPITVVEFGDFQCPVCEVAENTAQEIRSQYGNEIRFVFRQFPLVHLHAGAEKAAEASECAAEQGKFWEAVEKLYKGQSDLSEPALERYAAEIGLDMSRFNQCLSSGRMAARVRRDVADGEVLGVRGTPTFFVGQQRLVGAVHFSVFAQLIEHELAAHAVSAPPSSGSLPKAAPNHPQANKLTASTQPSRDPFSAGSGQLGNSGNGIFSEFQTSATACSEDEALKKQPTLIGTVEARQDLEGLPKALFVDVRAPKEYQGGRIPGAINVPAEEIQKRWTALPKGRAIVLYESGRTPGDICASSRAVGRFLLEHGFSHDQVKVYQDGLAGWEKAKLPIER